MKKAKKALLLVLCAILLVGASVAGTLAYLTDTKSVTNTFTVGNVQIVLDEATLVAETGEVDTTKDRTTTGNTDVRLIPGRTIYKDPTVTVLANSEECYVRMKVEVTDVASLKSAFEGLTYTGVHGTDIPYVTDAGMFQLHLLVEGWDANVWEYSGYDAGTYEFRYKGTVAKSTSDTELSALFTQLTIPGAMSNTKLALLDKVDIKVTAEAIQAEGFEGNADTAWGAFPAN